LSPQPERLVPSKAHHVRAVALVALLAAAVAPRSVEGQDSHYWAEQYGTRASLLGGAMIGSVRDVSGAFYNPGALGLHQEAGFVLSGRAYREGKLTLQNGGGEGRDLTSTNQTPIPTLLATPIDFSWLGRHVLVYSVLSRQQFSAGVTAQIIDTLDVGLAPGDEAVAAGYRAEASLRDTWTGLTWAYPITERFGIGVSQFLAIRNQSLGSRALLQGATASGEVGIATLVRDRSYKHYRTLTKVGVSAELGRLSLGATATTPSISLKGDGTAAYNASVAGIDTSGDGTEDPYLASAIQSDVPATYRSGWAVGGGMGLQLGDTRLHASAEWFDAIPTFTALDADPVVPQTGGPSIVNSGTVQLESVFNWGLGLEQQLGGIMVFAGLASDGSAGSRSADPATDMVLTTYDLMRYSAGSSFRLGRWELMLGLGYARGSQPFEPANLGPVDPLPDDLRLRYTQWTVVLGFERLAAEQG